MTEMDMQVNGRNGEWKRLLDEICIAFLDQRSKNVVNIPGLDLVDLVKFRTFYN